MGSRLTRIARWFAVVAPSLLAPLIAQGQAAPPERRYPEIRLSGRLHLQAYAVDNEELASTLGPQASFFVRRARIEAVGDITDRVSFVIQPSFENGAGREPNLRLRDAHITVRLTGDSAPLSLSIRAGQQKRPFSRYELASSNNLPSIERGAGRGMLTVSHNKLFEDAGFLAHDLGASVLLSAGPLGLQAGIFNGQGESQNDANDAKSFGARGTLALGPRLSVGAAVFSHDGLMEVPAVPPETGERVDSSFRNTAVGLDAAWGRPGDAGLFALVDLGQGERFAADEATMRGGSAVLALNFPRAGVHRLLHAIEPAIRIDVADPDVDAQDDVVRLYSVVLGFYLASRSHFRVAYEWQTFEDSVRSTIQGVRTALTVGF